jgi:hypothetical protein
LSESNGRCTEVLKALAQVQANVECVAKEKKAGMNYQIVSYDGLLDLIREDVISNGLMLVPHDTIHCGSTPYERGQGKHMNCDNYVIVFRLYHAPSGEFIQLAAPSIGIDEGDKGPGKALTYATKVAWEKLLMLKRGLEWESDARPSETMSRPAAPPPLKESSVTADPKTWPAPWPGMYERDLQGYDKEAMERTDTFDFFDYMEHMWKYLGEKRCPADVRKFYLRGLAVKVLLVALEGKHAATTIKSLRENMPRLEKLVLPQDVESINLAIKNAERL